MHQRLISDAHKVIGLLDQSRDVVPSVDPVKAALEAALQRAEEEWTEAQAARVSLQTQQTQVREGAVTLNRELIALRRILRIAVGNSHIDYQMLRTSRVAGFTEADEDCLVVEDAEQVDADATRPAQAPAPATAPLRIPCSTVGQCQWGSQPPKP